MSNNANGNPHNAARHHAPAADEGTGPIKKAANSIGHLLPLPAPADPTQRLVLFAVRRMAAHGVRDAYAANMFFSKFGINFRRPLVLLRAFMIELSQASKRTITIAPCCALRMTLDEGRLVSALSDAACNRLSAARNLGELTGDSAISSPLSVAAAFHNSLADLGLSFVD